MRTKTGIFDLLDGILVFLKAPIKGSINILYIKNTIFFLKRTIIFKYGCKIFFFLKKMWYNFFIINKKSDVANVKNCSRGAVN